MNPTANPFFSLAAVVERRNFRRTASGDLALTREDVREALLLAGYAAPTVAELAASYWDAQLALLGTEQQLAEGSLAGARRALDRAHALLDTLPEELTADLDRRGGSLQMAFDHLSHVAAGLVAAEAARLGLAA